MCFLLLKPLSTEKYTRSRKRIKNLRSLPFFSQNVRTTYDPINTFWNCCNTRTRKNSSLSTPSSCIAVGVCVWAEADKGIPKLELERFSLTSLRLPSNGTARVLPKKVHFHTIPVSRVTLSDFSSQDSPRCVRRKVNTRFLCRTSCLYFFCGGYWPK